MIKPEDVPDEVAMALNDCPCASCMRLGKETVADALNAWPGAKIERPWKDECLGDVPGTIILPLKDTTNG